MRAGSESCMPPPGLTTPSSEYCDVTHARLLAPVALMMLVACTRSSRPEHDLGVGTADSATTVTSGDGRVLRASAPVLVTAQDSVDAAAYEGVDGRGIPHYATAITLSADDAQVLRRAYGIEDPHRLYVSDSSGEGLLKYDTRLKRCLTCYVNSYRVGFVSVRRPGESWEEVERRVRSTPAHVFTGGANPVSQSTSDLDPDVQPVVDRMLRDARAAGFRFNVTATYRSPLREAFLMAEGKGRTHTLTSNHSYGRAVDIVIDDGNRRRPQTRRDWIAFREWVLRYRTPNDEPFRILGTPDQSWDWPHVELPSGNIGFDTIDQAIARGRACLAPDRALACNFAPHLPARLTHELVQ